MELYGIIEDVTDEPAHWLNPLVIVPKRDNIRICVDMREANKQLPALHNLNPQFRLKGSAVFTKLDLASVFHQIELDEYARCMTAFQSDT